MTTDTITTEVETDTENIRDYIASQLNWELRAEAEGDFDVVDGVRSWVEYRICGETTLQFDWPDFEFLPHEVRGREHGVDWTATLVEYRAGTVTYEVSERP